MSLRLNEIDRQLAVLVEDTDPSQRELNLQYVLLVCIAPIADELGLSTDRPNDGVPRKVHRDPLAHDFVVNNRDYRIPKGTFPVLDDYMATRVEREARLRAMPPAEALRGLPDPFPLEPSTLEALRTLAAQAKEAIRRRQDPY